MAIASNGGVRVILSSVLSLESGGDNSGDSSVVPVVLAALRAFEAVVNHPRACRLLAEPSVISLVAAVSDKSIDSGDLACVARCMRSLEGLTRRGFKRDIASDVVAVSLRTLRSLGSADAASFSDTTQLGAT